MWKTTGEIAEIIGKSPSTVIRMFDNQEFDKTKHTKGGQRRIWLSDPEIDSCLKKPETPTHDLHEEVVKSNEELAGQ